MKNDLKGKSALITGAAKRVGRAIGLALAAEGVNVAFNYRKSRAQAEETAQLLEGKGVRALAVQADLVDPRAREELVEQSAAAFGAIDILVNNASDFHRTPLEELAGDSARFAAEFDHFVELHMKAPLFLGMQLGLQMKVRGWGRIINITDRVIPRAQAYRHYSLYLASKYGLHGITQILAAELAPEVTVNSIAPGLVVAPPDFSETDVRNLTARIPLGRQAGVDEIASDVLHLVKSESKTGAVLITDGGSGLSTF